MVIAAAADDRLVCSCFVIMPYGVRDVGRRRVDFDRIYETIFKPAIRRVRVDGRTMIPLRADEPQQSRVLIHTMLRDLLLARLALADVSIENTNVGWELAHRHVGRPSGTALLALKGTKVPFDVSTVMVARYADTPPASAADSVGTIAGLLRATLRHNEVDSPSYTRSRELAALMGPPGNPTAVGEVMVEGEVAALNGAPQIAAQFYQKAAALAPGVPQLYQRQGMLLLESGNQELASLAFRRVLELDPGHDDARRILGDLKRGHRPETIASNPVESLAFKDLMTADRRLDIGRVMSVVGDCVGTSISIMQGPSKRGECHSLIRVISEPAPHSMVQQVLGRYGAATPYLAVDVPEANRTIYAFDVTSPNKTSQRSLVGELRQELSGLAGVGKVAIGGGRFGGGGSESGGGF